MEKVILISIDGMRPDGFLNCGNPFINDIMANAAYTLKGRTMFPSVTLPCHLSLFHSVPPERHGITTNTYIPFARPLNGLFEQLKMAGKTSAMFYGWEPLRDVARPLSLKYSTYIGATAEENVDDRLTDLAIDRINKTKPDFVFLYMVDTDEHGGHGHGWMSEEYLKCIDRAINNVKRVYDLFHDEYTIIITADHGGHDRSHGTTMDEDMIIPMFYIGPRFEKGRVLENTTILDIAPTICDIMGVMTAPEWEGVSKAQ